jgi:DnaK suppressor protein
MGKSDGAVYRERLLTLRARMRGDVTKMADVALNQHRNEGSSLPIHLADLGSDNFEQELTLNLMGSEKEALDQIEEALERIEEGTYGKCEECGTKIPDPRLEAIPYATRCINCAAQAEKHRQQQQEE